MVRYECKITPSVLRGVWVPGTLWVLACVGGYVCAQATHGPHSTRRDRTLSIPMSHTFRHSPLISIQRPWKFSWSYAHIWIVGVKEEREREWEWERRSNQSQRQHLRREEGFFFPQWLNTHGVLLLVIVVDHPLTELIAGGHDRHQPRRKTVNEASCFLMCAKTILYDVFDHLV